MKPSIQILALATLTAPVMAQGTTFSTPGMPSSGRTGQTDRFSTEFNPAIGGVIDTLITHLNSDGSGPDGFDLTLRSFEGTVNTWIDPNTWAYGVLVGTEEEGIAVEEAAVIYEGFDGNSNLKAGRFFVDFGKQMQAHTHDLPTFERPAVLSAYLGEELGGTGLQYGNWFPAGDSGAIRYSFGLYDSLVQGHSHGGHGDEEEGAAQAVNDYQEADELSYAARITGFHDAGENGVFQWGVSMRGLPEFAFDADLDDGTELTAEGMSNHVLGLDLTYGWGDDTGTKTWTVGGEYLRLSGEIGAEVDDAGTPGVFGDDTLEVLDSDRDGFYLWVDRGFDQNNSVGVLYSAFEHAEDGAPEQSELTAYYSRNLTEYSRLRVGVTMTETDDGDDSTALMVQFTNFFGSHAHGVNW
ncbi:MAG: hypothetical protein P1V35_02950 [Planctomycetota bacterium]|nr:hypothetical protein [Planctomycetota bacterium]